MARVCPLFSGSSGNSYYVGNSEEGVLIDAGRSAKQITEMLDACGIPLRAVRAVFITHEHTDHVSGLRVFAGKNRLCTYASPGTLHALRTAGILTPKHQAVALSTEGVECAGMTVRPFHIPHDCAEGYGFTVATSDGRKIAFCTDLGSVTEEVSAALQGCDLVVLESNHDVRMLQNGPYPYALKRRILSQRGHLSNEACSSLLPQLAARGTGRFLLAHLSKENNTPELAYQTSLCSLQMAGMNAGRDFELAVAPRENREHRTILF